VELEIDLPGSFTLQVTSGLYAVDDSIAIADADEADNGTASLNTSAAGIPLTSVSGSGASTIIEFSLPQVYYVGTMQYTRTDIPWPTAPASTFYVTYGLGYPPSDIYGTIGCTGEVYNRNATGDCYFREYVTWFMQQNCNYPTTGNRGLGYPPSPLFGQCAIHYFEGWNEFNSDAYWQGDYTELATMMDDADDIIHQFCGDCYFIVGSVSALDGSHQHYSQYGTNASAIYSEAMGQLLDDWHNVSTDNLRHSGVGLDLNPDALSLHPYPARGGETGGFYYPMPETNESHSSTLGGCNVINEPINYSYTWTESDHTHLTCRDSVISAINQFANTSTGIMSQMPSTFGYSTSTPVWNTESSYGQYFASDQGTATPVSPHDAHDGSLTGYINQSYVSRQAILTAASGDVYNNWYQSDNTLWGPLFFLPAPAWRLSTGYVVGNYVWDGKSMQECTIAGTSGVGPNQPSFNPTVGGTTLDGSVTWTNVTSNWVAMTLYSQGDVIWDGTHVQEVQTGGMSGATAPATWNATQGGTTSDGTGRLVWEDVISDPNNAGRGAIIPIPTVVGRGFWRTYSWLDGVTFTGTSDAYQKWAAGHAYALNATIYDGTFGVQRVVTAGTSGSSTHPTWAKGMYGTTSDGTGSLVWELMGTLQCNDTSTFSSTGAIQPAPWVCPISESGGNTGWLVWYTPLDSSYSWTVPAGDTCQYTMQGGYNTVSGGNSINVYNLPAKVDTTTCP
jgi:hypothetical protein